MSKKINEDIKVITDMVADFAHEHGVMKARGMLRIMDRDLFVNKEIVDVAGETCIECGERLPDPIPEARQGGHSEFITTCKCGAEYTSK